MKNEEHDDLWDLLGRAKKVEVSPFFARNVVREVRQLTQERPGFGAWLAKWWRVPAVAGALAAVAFAATAVLPLSRPASSTTVASQAPAAVVEADTQLLAVAETVSSSPDFQTISNLDELLDNDENSLWISGDIN